MSKENSPSRASIVKLGLLQTHLLTDNYGGFYKYVDTPEMLVGR